jgi:hypothetical protein
MNKYVLPELPSRFRWQSASSKGEIELEAFSTQWAGTRTWEGVGYIYWQGYRYGVRIWKLNTKRTGAWWEMEPVDSVEDGAKYLWTLVQLGEADFTFLESEDGN